MVCGAANKKACNTTLPGQGERERDRVKPPFTQTPAIGFGEQNPSSSTHPNSRPFASNHFGLERRTFYINHRHYGSSGCPEKDFTWSDDGTRIVDHRPPTTTIPLPALLGIPSGNRTNISWPGQAIRIGNFE